MTDQLSWIEAAAKAIGDPFATLGALLAGFVPEGPLRTLVLVIEGLCAYLARYIHKYYLGVLAQGAKPEGSIEREEYDKLRASLKGGNLAARLYAKWLTAFLDGVERFFGDAGTEGQRAFGLKKPAPLWTAPALDRCLLLALLYPVGTIFLIWAISGDVGPAEAALAMQPNVPGGQRGLIAAASFGFASFVIWRGLQAPGWKSLALINVAVAVVVAVPMAVTVTGGSVVVAAFAFAAFVAAAVAVSVAFAGARAGIGAVAGSLAYTVVVAAALSGGFSVTPLSLSLSLALALAVLALSLDSLADIVVVAAAFVVAFVVAVAVASAVAAAVEGAMGVSGTPAVAGALGVAGSVAVAAVLIAYAGAVAGSVASAVAVVNDKAIARRRQGIFLALCFAAMFLLCLVGADLLPPLSRGRPLLLFLGLLTLINAPFGWASLGLTRALLRRGLELGG